MAESFLGYLQEKLMTVRPEGAEDGCCLAYAHRATLVLIDDAEADVPHGALSADEESGNEQALLGEETYNDDVARYETTGTAEEAKNFFAFMQSKSVEAGGVYLLDTGDHSSVVFKSYQGRLYLLDSDKYFFKELKSADDLIAPKGTILADKPYHYFLDNVEGVTSLYYVGLADPSWQQKELDWAEKKESTISMRKR